MTGRPGGWRSTQGTGTDGSVPAAVTAGAITDRDSGPGLAPGAEIPDGTAGTGTEPARSVDDGSDRGGAEDGPPALTGQRVAGRQRRLASVAVRRLWASGAALVALQLVGLVAWSWHLGTAST